jgi:hypothetical protein
LWNFPEWVQVVASYNRRSTSRLNRQLDLPGEDTVLFSRTLPLIRYDMSESLQVAARQDCPWPPVHVDHRNPGTRTRITRFPDR